MTDLGICYAQPFWYDGETYTTNNTSIIFPLHVGRDHFDQIHLFVPYRETTDDRGPLALHLGTDDSLIPGLNPDRITIHPLPFKSSTREWYSAYAAADIVTATQQLRHNLPDCNLVWMPAPPHIPTMLCYILCRWYDIPLFLYIRSDQKREIDIQDFPGLLSLKQQFGGRLLPSIERHMVKHIPTIVTGPALYEKYESHAKSIYTIRSIHLSDRDVLENPGTEWSVPFRILYVGRLVPVKGVDRLVDAIETLVNRGYDVTLDIVGTGKEETALREQVESSSITDRVSFLGFVPFGPDLFKRYRRSDVFVLPSYSEGFPNVLLESMANGTPVITTNVGGIEEVIVNEDNGLLIPSGDTDAIVNAVVQLMADKTLYSDLVQSGIETVHQYTVENQEKKIIKALRTEFPNVLLN